MCLRSLCSTLCVLVPLQIEAFCAAGQHPGVFEAAWLTLAPPPPDRFQKQERPDLGFWDRSLTSVVHVSECRRTGGIGGVGRPFSRVLLFQVSYPTPLQPPSFRQKPHTHTHTHGEFPPFFPLTQFARAGFPTPKRARRSLRCRFPQDFGFLPLCVGEASGEGCGGVRVSAVWIPPGHLGLCFLAGLGCDPNSVLDLLELAFPVNLQDGYLEPQACRDIWGNCPICEGSL